MHVPDGKSAGGDSCRVSYNRHGVQTYQLVLSGRVLLLCLCKILLVLVVVGLLGPDNLLLALGSLSGGRSRDVGHAVINYAAQSSGECRDRGDIGGMEAGMGRSGGIM